MTRRAMIALTKTQIKILTKIQIKMEIVIVTVTKMEALLVQIVQVMTLIVNQGTMLQTMMIMQVKATIVTV